MRQEEKLHTDTEDTEENNTYYYKTGRESQLNGETRKDKKTSTETKGTEWEQKRELSDKREVIEN